ncbi:MAG: response regulator [Candidatus Omnitrophica bacterium]|nr:response regulator [Candidatus Omnitrophota bacterium]
MANETTILIIDDDPITLNQFTDVFLKKGFDRAMGAITGKEVRTIIADKKPTIVLLDANVKGEDSLKILNEIRIMAPLIPVIMLAEEQDVELAKRALELGACSYVIKTSAIADIVKEVKTEQEKRLGKPKDETSVMVVDDDKEIADMVNSFLTSEGYSCQSIYESRKAFSIIKAQRPDLIFLDIVMPSMDGIELLDQIKQLSKNIRVVMMSGVTDRDVCMEAITKGASGYITKPFSLQQLRVTVLTTLMEK